MAFRKLEDYKGKRSQFPQPADDIDPRLKENKEYFLAYCNAMVADYTNNACQVPFDFGMGRSFSTLRQYAQGRQGSAKLKDRLIGQARMKDGKYITKMNISWDTLGILPKMFDVIREKNQKIEYDVDARCIDTDSLQTKESDRKALKYFLQPQQKAYMALSGYRPQMNIDPQQMQMQDASDVDLFFDTGAYTMQKEIASIAACQKTKLVSGYKTIQDENFDDLITIGITGWKNYIDTATNEVKMRYVDAERAIIPYSKYKDFRDINKAGEIRTMTIAEIRKENPSLTEAELLYIAKSYAYMNPEYAQMLSGSGFYDTSFRTDYMSNYNVDPINRCRIQVLDAQWLSSDIVKKLYNTRGGRSNYVKDVDYGYTIDEKAAKNGDKLISKNVVKKFNATWIIGTNIMLKYGTCNDVVYYGPKGNKTPKLDYFFCKIANQSIVERCIAIVDDIDLANIKLRNAIACIPPAPRMIIQQQIMENVFLGGILQEPEDGMQTFLERGYLFVNGLDDFGKPIMPNQKMIEFMPSGVAEDITIFTNQIADGVNRLREVTGLNQVADASTPNPYVGFGKSQMAAQASNSALYPTFNAFNYLFENGFDDIVKKWQIIAKDKTIDLHYSPLGVKNMQVLSLGADFANSDFNISIEMSAGEEQRQQLLQLIVQQRDAGLQTNNQQGITMSEFLYVWDRVMNGNIREVMFILAQIEKKKQAASDAQAQANQKQNAADQKASTITAQEELRKTEETRGTQDRQTAVVTEAMKRKTAATTQFLKSKEMSNLPFTMEEYMAISQAADAEIAAILGKDMTQNMPAQPTAPSAEEQSDPGLETQAQEVQEA